MCRGIWEYKDSKKHVSYKSVKIIMVNYSCDATVIINSVHLSKNVYYLIH